MADYSHIRIKGEKRDSKRRKHTRMGMSGKSLLTVADQIRKKEQEAKRRQKG